MQSVMGDGGPSCESAAGGIGPSILILVLSEMLGRGGREAVIGRLLPALRALGARPTLALLDHARDRSWEAALAPPVVVRGLDPYSAIRRHPLAIVSYVRGVLRTAQPDAVLVTEPLGAPVVRLASIVLRRSRPLVLSWFHEAPEVWRHTWALRYCDAHLAVNRQVGRALERDCARPTYVVLNPIGDSPPLTPRPSDGILRLVYVGRLDKAKRVDRILRAVASVTSPGWRLQVVGDGTERRALGALADALGLSERVTWAGWSPEPWGTLKAASLALLTSDRESFGLVLAEAVARGIPVAAMDCHHGPREIVLPGLNGWLVPAGDVAALAALVTRLLTGALSLPPPEIVASTARLYRTSAVAGSIIRAVHALAGESTGTGTIDDVRGADVDL